MPRRSAASTRRVRTSNSTTYAPSSNSTALMAISKAIRSESEYRSALKKVNANAMILAEFLAISGPIEQTLLDSGTAATSKTNGSASQEGRNSRRATNIEEEKRQNELFLEEQRARLKSLVKRNITSALNVNSFIDVVNEVKGEVQTRQKRKRTDDDSGGSDDETAGEDLPNYEVMIQSKMEEAQQSRDQNGVDMKNHPLMKRYREMMGEKDDQANEDEDLEVVHQSGGAESDNAVLKCKMTLQRFVKPYKNRICGHVYEYDAIVQYLRSKRACPMPGCNNQNVTVEQLEEDEEMRIKVRRKNRREEEEKLARVNERYEMESDEGEDGGVTLID